MERRIEKCKHGFYPDVCAICKGLVTKNSQKKSYGKVKDVDLQDLEDESENTEEQQYQDLESIVQEEELEEEEEFD